MKLPGLLTLAAAISRGAASLASLTAELAGIRAELKRLADHTTGTAPYVPLPPAEDEGPTLAFKQDDATYARIEAIERRFYATAGRLPTPEEIARELDEIEISPEESQAEYQARYGRPLQ